MLFCFERTALLPALFSLLTLAGSAAASDEPDASDALRLSGFGTLGYSVDDNDQAASIRDITQRPRHLAYTDESWRLDSRLGLQVDYRFTPSVRGAVQWVLRDQIADGLDDATEQAFLDWTPSSALDLRVGRIGLDGFMMSDHRNLGYAYDWVRPPQEFYGMLPIFYVDGADITYNWPVDDGRWRFRLQQGNNAFTLPFGDNSFRLKTRITLAASVVREFGPWRMKAAINRFDFNEDVPAFASIYAGLDQIAGLGLPGVSDEAAAVRRDLSYNNAHMLNINLGASYDDGVWTHQAELGYSDANHSLINPGELFAYLKVGRRFGNYTPFFMVRASHPLNDVKVARQDWSAATGLPTLNTNLRDLAFHIANASRIEQESLAIGVRWDIHDNAALKLQWDHSRAHERGHNLWFADGAEGLRSDFSVNQWSINLDFVF